MGHLDEVLARAKAAKKQNRSRSCQVSDQHLCENLVLCDNSPIGMAEEYNMLRTNVVKKLDDQGLNSLVVTSPGVNEGKTLIALNLAICKARQHGKTVLLVDADLRRPAVHKYLGLAAEHGLADYLTGNKELPELLINPAIANLSILPAGKPLAMSAEHIASPRMQNLAREIKNRYSDRYIIFDTPPLLLFPEAHVIADYADGILLVVQSGRTSADDLGKAVKALNGANILGVVLNKV